MLVPGVLVLGWCLEELGELVAGWCWGPLLHVDTNVMEHNRC
jgi:hypothetical protein